MPRNRWPLILAAEEIASLLRGAGLSDEPLFGSVGVAGHLERLASGAVSADTLRQYAADLAGLNAFTAANGASIPTTFWDVETEAMRTAGDDVYTNAFRQNLDASLDLLLLVDDYYLEVAGPPPGADDPEGQVNYANAKIMVWQSLISGTSRINPLTGEPLAVLNGIEEQKVLSGEADPAEARADQTLNGLVNRVLLADYPADSAAAVAAMRCNLKGTCA